MTKLRKISVEKSPSVSSPRKNFSCRQRSPKMAELRKDSVKNLRLYHLPSKKFLVPKKGVLKWPSCEKISVKNLRTYQPLSKIFLVPIKGVLKWLSCETVFVKNLRPYPVEIFLRADKGGPKMIELRKNSVKNLRLYHLLIEKMFSCR